MAAEKAEVRKIQMKDGREVEFAGKRKMLKEIVVERDRVLTRLDFDSGDTLKAYVPAHHLLYAAGHGLGQKLGDSVAGLKNDDGSAASSEDMYLVIEELYTDLNAENSSWNQKGEGTGIGGQSVLLRAMVEFTGKTTEEVKAFLAKRDAKEKMALRASDSPKIGKSNLTLSQVIQKIEAEKKAKAPKIDTDALLAAEGMA